MTRPTGRQNALLHVLIVDDNLASAQTTGWMVEMMGHGYALAEGAATAVASAAENAPDVVLLDIGLPGTNGFDVCRDMRLMPGLEDTMFIAHSGYGDTRTRALATEVGFAHFLLKPFEPEALQAMLDEAAQRRASKD